MHALDGLCCGLADDSRAGGVQGTMLALHVAVADAGAEDPVAGDAEDPIPGHKINMLSVYSGGG